MNYSSALMLHDTPIPWIGTSWVPSSSVQEIVPVIVQYPTFIPRYVGNFQILLVECVTSISLLRLSSDPYNNY